jgi:hypothetical protein
MTANKPFVPMGTLNADQRDELEALIDKTSLAGVVFALVQIANEKGEHVATNWGDAVTAKYWFRAANRIDKIVDAVNNLGV